MHLCTKTVTVCFGGGGGFCPQEGAMRTEHMRFMKLLCSPDPLTAKPETQKAAPCRRDSDILTDPPS